MSDAEQDLDVEQAEKGEGTSRERSTIAFPYDDLNSAVAVANAIYQNVGTGECDAAQIAGWMAAPLSSGSHRVKVSAARIFGFVENEKGKFKLLPLGKKLFDKDQKDAALVDGFLSVPLYRKIYDEYKGHDLPNAQALEKHIADLGVSSKQKDKARQVFERSAEQAGFFKAAKGRLVAPGTRPGENGGGKSGPEIPPPPQEHELHPFIRGLLDKLPVPETEWSIPDRIEWLEATVSIFNLMYKGKGKIRIEAQRDQQPPATHPDTPGPR